MAPPPTILFLLPLFISVEADTFVWRLSSNWADLSNWNQGRLPCAAETAVVKRPAAAIDQHYAGERIEFTIDANVTLKKLVIPQGSDIKLLKGVRINLSQNTTCEDAGLPSVSNASMNEFIGVQPHPWNCANNWERLSDKTRATRVPCAADTVQFQSGKSYSWISLSTDIQVAGLEWYGRSVSNLSEIPNYGAYFVKENPSADLTANPACAKNPSICRCLPTNCTYYPTSPPPPTTKAPTTLAPTTTAPATTAPTTAAPTTAAPTTTAPTTAAVTTTAPTTTGPTTTLPTTKPQTTRAGTAMAAVTTKQSILRPKSTEQVAGTASANQHVKSSSAKTAIPETPETQHTGTPCNPRDIGCKHLVICTAEAGNCTDSQTNTQGSDSTNWWPIIVGGLAGALIILIIVIVVMVLLRRQRSYSYQEEQAQYDVHTDDSKMHLSFDNPVFNRDTLTHDNALYEGIPESSQFSEDGGCHGIYQDVDVDGLPI